MRLTLLSANPNATGVLIGSLILLNGFFRSKLKSNFGQSLSVCIGGALWGGLALTQSRSAFLGCAAACFISLMTKRGRSRETRASIWQMFLACSLVLAAVAVSGLGTRFAHVNSTDPSIQRRLSLWHGACELIALRPLTGFGGGTSGYLYTQWLQPPQHTSAYGSLVSAYLTVAVERGLVALSTLFFALFFAIGVGVHICRRNCSTTSCDVGALLVGIVVNVGVALAFNSLLRETIIALQLMALLSASMMVGYKMIDIARLKKIILFSGASAAAISLSLYVGARAIKSSQTPWILNQAEVNFAWFHNPTAATKNTLLIVSDKSVCGTFFGRENRKVFFGASSRFSDVVISDTIPAAVVAPDEAIFMGAACAFIDDCQAKWTMVINPLVPPPAGEIKIATLVISEVDSIGYFQRWREKLGPETRVKIVYGYGTYIGSALNTICELCCR